MCGVRTSLLSKTGSERHSAVSSAWFIQRDGFRQCEASGGSELPHGEITWAQFGFSGPPGERHVPHPLPKKALPRVTKERLF